MLSAQSRTWIAASLLAAGASAGCAAEPSAPPQEGTAAFLASLAPSPLVFTIDASLGGPIQGSGTSFRIPPGVIFTPGGEQPDFDTDGDGVPDSTRAKGKVKVLLRELLSAECMAAAGRPTVTSDGQLLETGGAFDLTFQAASGQALQVAELRNLRIKPTVQPSSPAGMELWLADANAPGEFGWNRPPGGPVAAEASQGTFSIPIVPAARPNRPTTSKNVDKPRPAPQTAVPAAPVRVELAGAALVAPGTDDSAVFFYPEGISSVVQLQRDETGAYSAPASVMHADLTGRLVVVSTSGDGRYFYQERQVSLSDERSFVIEPAEVTRAEVRARMITH